MYTKYMAYLLSGLLLSTQTSPCMAITDEPKASTNIQKSQWKGKRVAFLGDSITDKKHVGTTKNYWQYLAEMLGIEPLVYGINGNQWNGVLKQAQRLKAEIGNEVDAIIIFAGTNEYNAGFPLGEWYTDLNSNTFRGRINEALSYLKQNFPDKQIILMTPIHRAQARFSNENIQPEEAFPNKLGLYVDEYVNIIKEAGNVWAVPVIDLNSISGLYPMFDTHAQYFHDEVTDRLHPNAKGHYRMAKAIMYQLLAYPADFE